MTDFSLLTLKNLCETTCFVDERQYIKEILSYLPLKQLSAA